MPQTPGLAAPAEPLPLAFQRLVATRFFCTIAGHMQAIVMGWQVWALTHSAMALGLVGLAEAAPALGIAMWAGHFVDTHDPRRVLRAVALFNMSTALVLGLVLWLQRHNPDPSVRLWTLYTVSVSAGAARSFWSPCIYALVPTLVPRARLAQATAWMGSVHQLAQVLGPAVGGLIFARATGGPTCVVLAMCLAWAYLLSLRLGEGTVRRPPRSNRAKGEVTRGLRFVIAHPVLLSALSLDMVSVLFGGVTALLPMFAEQVLHCGPQGLGLLRAAPAVGASLAGLLLYRFEIRPRAGQLLLVAVAGFGFCILCFANSRTMAAAGFALIGSGLCDGVSMVVRSLIIQLLSPDHLRGRISAVNSMFLASSNELGEFESGVMASQLGLLPSMCFGGVMCLATVLIVAWQAPALRRLDLTEV